jgi:phytoene dehydrogenase-like protein
VCEAHLARAGFAVTVLEQVAHPGGAVSSHTDTLPGFVHDRCAAFFPLAGPARVRRARRARAAGMANPGVAMAYPFADGTEFALHRDLDATVASLGSTAPGPAAGGRRRSSRCWARDRVVRAALTPALPPVRDGMALALRLRRDGVEVGRQLLASSATFSREGCATSAPQRGFRARRCMRTSPREAPGERRFAFALKLLGHAVVLPRTRRVAVLATLGRATIFDATEAPWMIGKWLSAR